MLMANDAVDIIVQLIRAKKFEQIGRSHFDMSQGIPIVHKDRTVFEVSHYSIQSKGSFIVICYTLAF